MYQQEEQNEASPSATQAQLVRLQPLPAMHGTGAPLLAGRLDLIGELKVRVRAILGEGELSVSTLLGLQDGSIVPLSCGTHPLVDIELDGKTIARGQLVLVEDAMGVHITEVASEHG